MPGQVYVFNCYNESGVFGVGNTNTGKIAAWGAPSSQNPYQPVAVAVQRIKHADERTPNTPAFANGDVGSENPCTMSWDSFTANINNIHIPGPSDPRPVSIDDDLILYFTWNKSFLMDTRGFVIATYPYTPMPLRRR
jgi:hypothetical protein